MSASPLKYGSPFLSNATLRSVDIVVIDDVKILAKELLDFAAGCSGQLVVNDGLRRALETGYNKHLAARGKPPRYVTNSAYPEKLFIPRLAEITQLVEGGRSPFWIPQTRKLLLFFAVAKKF